MFMREQVCVCVHIHDPISILVGLKTHPITADRTQQDGSLFTPYTPSQCDSLGRQSRNHS